MDYICYPPTISGINLSGTSLALLARRARVAVSMVARIAVIGILISAVLGGLLVSYVFNSPTPELRPTEDVLIGGECSLRNAASNQFIREFVIPTPCSAPIGITVDEMGIIWFSETNSSKIGNFNPKTGTFREFLVPRGDDGKGAESWSLAFDQDGILWFTDHENNAVWSFDEKRERFERYDIPTPGSFPVQLVIDNRGNLWISEIYGNKIAKLDPSIARANSTSGFEEFEPPGRLDLLGGVWVAPDGRIWIAMLTYPIVGRIAVYDPVTEEFEVFDLPDGISSPVGIAADSEGRVWISDHGTSQFVLFNTNDGSFTRFSTSRGQTVFPVSLPYWNMIDKDGNMWFNVHQANTIAKFDVNKWQLVEYEIPTRNEDWGGIANALQFTIDQNGNIWFTEWTESKIGFLDASAKLPISIDAPITEAIIRPGSSIELDFTLTSEEPVIVTFETSGTFSLNGELRNVTAVFSNPSPFEFEGQSTVKLTLDADTTLLPGEYTLMVSFRSGPVTVSVPIQLTVI